MYAQDAVERAMAETNEFKGHWHNCTAGSTEESLRRLEYAYELGSRMIMYDFLTAGFAASADIFKRAGELDMIVHCHRAMHAVFTRQANHGIAMRVVAKWLRLTGGDHLHTGTVVGKLEGSWNDTLGIIDTLRERYVKANLEHGLYFDQDFGGLKATWPVASGGIHVHHVPDLLKIYGPDAFFLFGGGTHGHPDGSRAGAAANRAAVEGVLAGQTLEQIARTSPELRKSMELWSGVKFEVVQ
jgi:ribulose-bisphosphate carboxylase large chain